MKKPVSRVLIINDEPLVLKEFVKGLNAAARSLDNPLGITFSGVTTAREALAAIEEDGDLQAVVVDDKLYTLNQKSPKKEMSALELVQRVTRFRPELDVYILIAQEHEDEIVDALFAEAVDGYFYREERDYRGMYRILNAQVQERSRTPFYDQLKNYVWMAKDSWHTPGHSSGESLRGSPWVNDFCDFMGEHVFDADLSVSVKMLDSLMEPTGVIAEAQTIAAKAFGARRTFFATNGTSTSNKVIFQTLLALRLHGRTYLRRRSLGVGEDARLADGAHRRDRRGSDHRGQGLRRAPHVLCDQRYLDLEQGDFPDAPRTR